MGISIYTDYKKVVDTILSCKTHAQHLGANELVKLFRVKWGGHNPCADNIIANAFRVCDKYLRTYLDKQWNRISTEMSTKKI